MIRKFEKIDINDVMKIWKDKNILFRVILNRCSKFFIKGGKCYVYSDNI